MTRAKRTFDRADLRRASLNDLTETLAGLDRTPRPPAKAARRSLTNHKNAVRAEIAIRLQTGQPSANPHKGLPRRRTTTGDQGLAAFFEECLGPAPQATRSTD